MNIGAPELIVVLIVVMLIFGVDRIGQIGGELGSGIRAFKDALETGEENEKGQDEA